MKNEKKQSVNIRSSAAEFLIFSMQSGSDSIEVQLEGTRNVVREIEHYNLDAIISVGYRVNSMRATQFRRWATKIHRIYTITPMTMQDCLFESDFDKLDAARKVIEDTFI